LEDLCSTRDYQNKEHLPSDCDAGPGEFVDAWFDAVSLFGFWTLFVLERNPDII
jgi:hypothetical protein